VLDVGCREGRLSNALCERFAMVVGVDIDAAHLISLKTSCCQADLFHLPFGADSFDLVICTEVLEHLQPDREQTALREMSRVARHYILVTVPWRQPLLPGLVRCPECRSVFHVSGHVREFFHETDLPTPSGFRLRTFIPMVPITRGPRLMLLARLAHRLGAYMAPASPPVYCPTCRAYVTADNSSPLAGRIVWSIRTRLSHTVRQLRPAVVAGWAAWLFERDSHSADAGGL